MNRNEITFIRAAWYKCDRCHHETPSVGRPLCEACGCFSTTMMEAPTLKQNKLQPEMADSPI